MTRPGMSGAAPGPAGPGDPVPGAAGDPAGPAGQPGAVDPADYPEGQEVPGAEEDRLRSEARLQALPLRAVADDKLGPRQIQFQEQNEPTQHHINQAVNACTCLRRCLFSVEPLYRY